MQPRFVAKSDYFAKTYIVLLYLARYKSIVMEKIAGREGELALLSKIIQSLDAELVAVYGRRRVGKAW